jgi:hypothetical protein
VGGVLNTLMLRLTALFAIFTIRTGARTSS